VKDPRKNNVKKLYDNIWFIYMFTAKIVLFFLYEIVYVSYICFLYELYIGFSFRDVAVVRHCLGGTWQATLSCRRTGYTLRAQYVTDAWVVAVRCISGET